MNRTEYLRRTIAVITSEGQFAAPVAEDAHFIRDLNLDSLQIMQILGALEDEFQTTVPLDELPNLQTVSEAALLIEELCGADAAVPLK